MKAIKKFIGIFLIAALTLSASFTTVFAAIPDENGIQSLTEHEKEHHGYHQIKHNGQVIGILEDYVYGVYSQADNYSLITDVSVVSYINNPTGYYAGYILIEPSDTAYGRVYYGTTLIMQITYTLHQNGYLEENIVYY